MPTSTSNIDSPSVRVAYQGTAGAFGEQAVRAWWPDAEPHGVRTFSGVIAAVTNRLVAFAVIPVWNSAIGRVADACHALEAGFGMVESIDEVEVRVRHCLIALSGARLDDVRYVGSHPAAFAQCTRFLRQHSLITCEAYNTAGAAHELAEYWRRAELADAPWYATLSIDKPAQLGVIASAAAADRSGLVVLREDVQDDPANVTRFVVLRACRR
jgi:prephenate dehydratase